MRTFIQTFLLSLFFLTALPVVAADFNLIQIVPEQCQACPCGFGGVLEIIRRVMNLAIVAAGIIATFTIIYAGFLFIASAANPESRKKASSMLLGAAIGLVLVLGAWLIIDAFMRFFYSGPNGNEGVWGPWNSIVAEEGEWCVVAKPQNSLFENLKIGQIPQTVETGPPPNPNPISPSTGGANCSALTNSELRTVDSYPLLASTAERYIAMKKAAEKDGITLIITSGYRSPTDQERAWRDNVCNLVNGKAVCQSRTAAVPCSLGGGGSNHTRGTAVDIRLNTGVYDWLVKNASRFGFYNKLPNDLVHWSDTGR